MSIERPILFNGEMVRAIIAGRKTQTRRIIKQQPDVDGLAREIATGRFYDTGHVEYRPPYREGDVLYVRETWVETNITGCYVYRADFKDTDGRRWDSVANDPDGVVWRPSIHMPKEAARLWLNVSDVCVERLQYISYSDAMAEGVTCEPEETPREAFQRVWEKCYGEDSWNKNPFVWVIKFEVVKK